MKAYGKDLEKLPTIVEASPLLSRTDVLRVLSDFISDKELSCNERLKAVELYIKLVDEDVNADSFKDVVVTVKYDGES